MTYVRCGEQNKKTIRMLFNFWWIYFRQTQRSMGVFEPSCWSTIQWWIISSINVVRQKKTLWTIVWSQRDYGNFTSGVMKEIACAKFLISRETFFFALSFSPSMGISLHVDSWLFGWSLIEIMDNWIEFYINTLDFADVFAEATRCLVGTNKSRKEGRTKKEKKICSWINEKDSTKVK